MERLCSRQRNRLEPGLLKANFLPIESYPTASTLQCNSSEPILPLGCDMLSFQMMIVVVLGAWAALSVPFAIIVGRIIATGTGADQSAVHPDFLAE
jgi:hypothetical protein